MVICGSTEIKGVVYLSEKFPASLRKIFSRDKYRDESPSLVDLTENCSHDNHDGGSGNDGYLENLHDSPEGENSVKSEDIADEIPVESSQWCEKYDTNSLDSSRNLPKVCETEYPTSNDDQCGAKLRASQISAETGKKVKDALQKGREFLKRKFSDYQHKFKAKWDGSSRMSLSSSSETNDDENLAELVLKREPSACSFTEDSAQRDQSIVMEANGQNGEWLLFLCT